MKRILLTGFQPFLGESINPSAQILERLRGLSDVRTLLLPVSFAKAFSHLRNFWETNGPFDAILMLGQAGGRTGVCLERIAVNWIEGTSPDEDGFTPPVGPVIADATTAYVSDFFPHAWGTHLKSFGPTEVSHSAGAYVCNALYFQTRHFFPAEIPVLFTHVPYLPEQTVGKAAGTASMELGTQVKIIRELIGLMQKD